MKKFFLLVMMGIIYFYPHAHAAGKKSSKGNTKSATEKKLINEMKKKQEEYLEDFRLEVASGNGKFGSSILNLHKASERYMKIDYLGKELFGDPLKYEAPIHELYDEIQASVWKLMALRYLPPKLFDGDDGAEMRTELISASTHHDALFASKNPEVQKALQSMYQSEEFVNPLSHYHAFNGAFFNYFLDQVRLISEEFFINEVENGHVNSLEKIHKSTLFASLTSLELYSKVAFRLIFCNSLFFAQKHPELFQLKPAEKKHLANNLLSKYYEKNKKLFLCLKEQLEAVERYFNAVYFAQKCIVENKWFLEKEVLVKLPEIKNTLDIPTPLQEAIQKVGHNFFARKQAHYKEGLAAEEAKRIQDANLKKQKKSQKHPTQEVTTAFERLSVSEKEPIELKNEGTKCVPYNVAEQKIDEAEQSRLQKIVADWINYGKWSEEGFNIVNGTKLASKKARVLNHVDKHFVQESGINALLELNGMRLQDCANSIEYEGLLEFLQDPSKIICSSFIVPKMGPLDQCLQTILSKEHTVSQLQGQEILQFAQPLSILKFVKYKEETLQVELGKTCEVYVHYNHRKEISTLYPKMD